MKVPSKVLEVLFKLASEHCEVSTVDMTAKVAREFKDTKTVNNHPMIE